MLVFFPSFFAAHHGLSHIRICLPIFHSSADHCRACIVVDGWEMATAYALPSKGGAAWLVNCHMGYFPIGDSHQWAETAIFYFFWFITTLCICSILSFICIALFFESFPVHFPNCALVSSKFNLC